MPELDFFHCLESALEPVFSATDYAQIPQALRNTFETNKLFRDAYLNEIECDKCDACPENNALAIKYDQTTNRRFYTCPTGYLKNPVWLADDEVKGKQFDFDKLADLICAKSKIKSGGETDVCGSVDIESIAYDQIDSITVAVTYCYYLRPEEDVAKIFSMFNADVLFIITPSIDTVGRIRQSQNTYPITLKTVVENDFDLRAFISQKLPGIKSSPEGIPVPPGAMWQNIKIVMEQDEDHCEISIGSEAHSYKYDNPKLGGVFINKRDKKPNALWGLLIYFAKGNGRIGWKKSGYAKQAPLSADSANGLAIEDYSGETAKVQITHPKDQKAINTFKTNKKLLCDALQKIFPGINGEPISYSKKDKKYITNFGTSYRIDIPRQ